MGLKKYMLCCYVILSASLFVNEKVSARHSAYPKAYYINTSGSDDNAGMGLKI
jgi:hypothetical protein